MIKKISNRLSLNSIRSQLIIVILFMILPLIAFLIYSNSYAGVVVRNQVKDSYYNMMTVYMKQIDKDLESVMSYIHNYIALDANFLSMEEASSEERYMNGKILVSNELNKKIMMFEKVDAFFTYSKKRDDFLDVYNDRPSYEDTIKIKAYIASLIDKNLEDKNNQYKQWKSYEIGGNYYLLYIVKSGDMYFGAWMNVAKLMLPIEPIDLGPQGGTLFTTNQGIPMTNKELVEKSNIDLKANTDSTKDDFVVINQQAEMGDFRLVSIIPNNKILEGIPVLQRISLFFLLSLFLVIPIGFIVLRKIMLKPVYRLISAMQKVQDNNMDIRMKEYKTSDEFMLLNTSFNSMLSQIEQLKIEVYEEQIEKQKEELQRLQLQMNPHFFMNALNIIFSLAKIRDYNLISEMSLCLIRYFQFIFRDNLTFVKLKDEIEHTKNYLRIQELRYPEKFTFTICAPNSLSDTLVPPLFIQIFAENSIKHAVTLDEAVHLSINIDCIERENVSYLKVMIEDTGKGFPVHILEKLKSNQGIENAKGEHIGISNITRRLRLLYQDHASIEFKNNKPNGAVVELMLPLNPEITQGGMCYVPIANR